jgi:hypothetical protein
MDLTGGVTCGPRGLVRATRLYSAVPRSWPLRCTECQRLAREFEDAWRSDQEEVQARFQETAEAAGREPEAFLRQWVTSLGQMPDDEFDSLQWARSPRVAEVRRRWKEHATLSGHSGLGTGWRGAFIFDATVRSGYYGFLKGRGRRD